MTTPADGGRIPRGAAVVGASRGIGRAVARELARRGFTVAALARDAASLRELEAEVGPGAVSPFPGDVSDPQQLEELITAAHRALPPLGVVVHCAASSGPVGPVWEVDVDDISRTLGVNVTSAFITARLVLEQMVSEGSGRLLMLSSGAARRPTGFRALYGGSKASVDHLVRSVGHELASRAPGVAIASIYPGVVATDMQAELRRAAESAAPDVRDELAAVVTRVSEPVSPEAVATSIAALLDRESRTVNGRILALRDGSWQEV